MSGVDGKVVLLTGAGGGLGRATAMQLAQRGAKLALTDNNAERLNETLELLRASGGAAIAHAGDVVSPDTSARLVADAVQTFHGLDAVCNIAGVLGGRQHRRRHDGRVQSCNANQLHGAAAHHSTRGSGVA